MSKKLSFEERLTVASSPERVKSAKQLLKNDRLIGAWRDNNGRINAVFSDKGRIFTARVITGVKGAANIRHTHHFSVKKRLILI